MIVSHERRTALVKRDGEKVVPASLLIHYGEEAFCLINSMIELVSEYIFFTYITFASSVLSSESIDR